jgi:hypothetical protein
MTFSTLNTHSSLSITDMEELQGTAKWARIVAIIGFVMLGLMLVFGLAFGSFFGKIMAMQSAMSGAQMPFDPSLFGIFYAVLFLVMVMIYFFPTLFLYQYATRTLRSLKNGFDATTFSSGLRAHRSFYSYIGVLMIIVTVLYALMFIFLGIAMAMMPSIPTMPEGMTM